MRAMKARSWLLKGGISRQSGATTLSSFTNLSMMVSRNSGSSIDLK